MSEATPPESPTRASRVPSWARRATFTVPAIAVLGIVVGAGVATAISVPQATKATEQATSLSVQLDDSQSRFAVVERNLSTAKKDLQSYKSQVHQVEAREERVEVREAELATREAAATELETSVKEREDAAAELARSSDWWIEQVRECLARPGSYRMASATEGSLGRDVSCMSG